MAEAAVHSGIRIAGIVPGETCPECGGPVIERVYSRSDGQQGRRWWLCVNLEPPYGCGEQWRVYP